MKCPSGQEGDVDRDDCQILGNEQVGMRRPANREIEISSRVPRRRYVRFRYGCRYGARRKNGTASRHRVAKEAPDSNDGTKQ